MTYKTSNECGEIIDALLIDNVSSTPVTSVTDQMYLVGEGKAFVTVQCDNKGKEKNVFCIKHIKKTTKYIKIEEPQKAKLISNACKLRLQAFLREQAKINKINQRFEITR